MSACRETDLDALLAGELSPEDAARVDAHVDTCPACRHAMTWLRLERGWMAQRARRTPARPALDFAALEARLSRPAARPWVPLRGAWTNWGRMLMAATAAVAFVGLSLTQTQGGVTSLVDEPFGRDARSSLMGEACEDPSREAVAALEASLGACLVASPLISSR